VAPDDYKNPNPPTPNSPLVSGPMGDLSEAAAAVKSLCEKVSTAIDGPLRLLSMFDFDKIERILRAEIAAGATPDIFKDK
jgi:hypothetical protein